MSVKLDKKEEQNLLTANRGKKFFNKNFLEKLLKICCRQERDQIISRKKRWLWIEIIQKEPSGRPSRELNLFKGRPKMIIFKSFHKINNGDIVCRHKKAKKLPFNFNLRWR